MPKSTPTTVVFLVRVRVRGDRLDPRRLPCHSVAADMRKALRKHAPHITLEDKGAVRASRVLLPERK